MSYDNYPLVTVITPAYNRASFLDETIQSVLNQGYPNLQYLLLDDGSSDNTLEVAQKYAEKITIYHHENIGETRTVNKGFSLALGEIIVVVNSDDPLLPNSIATGVEALRNNPDAVLAYTDWYETGTTSEILNQVSLPEYDINLMLSEFVISMGPGTFIRRSALECCGFRDTQFRYAADIELWFRLALHGPFVHIPQFLATHRVHPNALSSTAMGSLMASELLLVVQKTYSISADSVISCPKSKALYNAHLAAAKCCGDDKLAQIDHLWAAFKKYPISFMCRHIVIGLAKKFPEPISNRLRNAWQQLSRKSPPKRHKIAHQ